MAVLPRPPACVSTEMSQPQNLSRAQKEKITQWAEAEGQAIARELVQKKVLRGHVKVESRWILPGKMYLGVAWSESQAGPKYWVTGGEMLTRDYVSLDTAETPRDAARHFALQWQLNGARIGLAADEDAEMDWEAVERRMIERAEALYAMTEEDRYW